MAIGLRNLGATTKEVDAGHEVLDLPDFANSLAVKILVVAPRGPPDNGVMPALWMQIDRPAWIQTAARYNRPSCSTPF
jgi:hypothetical protein